MNPISLKTHHRYQLGSILLAGIGMVILAACLVVLPHCAPAEQQQTAQGAREAAEATHAVSTICMAIATGFPEVEAKCKTVHDAAELVLQNLPTACAVPDAGAHD